MIQKALGEGRTTLSEYEAKLLLASYGLPVAREIPVYESRNLTSAAREIGYPVVLKGCAAGIAHKTEKDLVRVDIRNDSEAEAAFGEITAKMNSTAGFVLVQEMVKGERELMVGMTRDPQFGPCVMFGLGGIFTEVLKDVSFRMAPLSPRDATDMMSQIRGHRILNAVRGMGSVNRDELAEILIRVGRIGLENERIKEIDINPLIIRGGSPIAVDALVVLG